MLSEYQVQSRIGKLEWRKNRLLVYTNSLVCFCLYTYFTAVFSISHDLIVLQIILFYNVFVCVFPSFFSYFMFPFFLKFIAKERKGVRPCYIFYDSPMFSFLIYFSPCPLFIVHQYIVQLSLDCIFSFILYVASFNTYISPLLSSQAASIACQNNSKWSFR